MTASSEFRAGVLLRAARRIARLSQRELAERAGTPAATVARIESGATRSPGVELLAHLLAAAGFRIAVVSATGAELAPHPFETERDFGGRHYPAHLRLLPMNRPYWPGPADWHGWYRSWAWQPGARIPDWTYRRRPRRGPPSPCE